MVIKIKDFIFGPRLYLSSNKPKKKIQEDDIKITLYERNSNVNFLKNNFKRNWIVSRDKKRDHTVLILNDEPIGKYSKNIQ